MNKKRLKSSKIKAVVFDIGDVIHPIRWEAPLKKLISLNPALTTDKFKQSFYKECEHSYTLYKTGKITQEEFWPSLTSRLNISEINYQKVREAFHFILGPPNPTILDMVNKLKDNYSLFILSNSCPELEHEVYRYSYTSSFTRIYFSHRLGKMKPNHEIFQILLTENHLDSHDCVFIDDKSANIESAKNIGFTTIHFTSAHNTFTQLSRLIDDLPY